jgi:hypothetical protein
MFEDGYVTYEEYVEDDGGKGESESRAKQWQEFAMQSIPSTLCSILCLH